MATLVREALEAGALGFSTSRFYGHVDKQGKLIPGTHASAKEMRTITSAFKGLDHGTIEIISDYLADADEQAWIEDILRSTKRPVTTLMGAGIKHPIWKFAERMNAEGFAMRPQVGARPASILMSLEGTINPMRIYPAYKEIASRPLEERVRLLRDPEFRHRVISEAPRHHRNADARRFTTDFAHMFPLDDALSYEPGEADSVAALAKSGGWDSYFALNGLVASAKIGSRGGSCPPCRSGAKLTPSTRSGMSNSSQSRTEGMTSMLDTDTVRRWVVPTMTTSPRITRAFGNGTSTSRSAGVEPLMSKAAPSYSRAKSKLERVPSTSPVTKSSAPLTPGAVVTSTAMI